MKKLLIAAVAYLAMGCAGVSAGPVANPVPEYKEAKLHASCQDEDTLSSMHVAKPLICIDHKWQQVVFKSNEEGTTQRLEYNGKCSFRFADGQEQSGAINIKAGQIADVCIPAGWKYQLAVASNTLDWAFTQLNPIENVMVLKSRTPGANSTAWFYVTSPGSKEAQKIVVNLRTLK